MAYRNQQQNGLAMFLKNELNSQLDKMNEQISELTGDRIDSWTLKRMKEKLNRVGRKASKLDKEDKFEIKQRVHSVRASLKAAIEKKYLTEKIRANNPEISDSASVKKRL
ncbi:hypothetical protein AB6896_02050 [Rahnella inusitata]|nr:hypothetical protein [Rahnella woolbedingensis]